MNSLPVCSQGKITISERKEEKGSKLSFKLDALYVSELLRCSRPEYT